MLVAASRHHPDGHPHAGRRVSRHPQLAIGLVLDTPGNRTGPNTVHALTQLVPLGLPAGLLIADRAYTEQLSPHFATPARRLGYRLVLDYKQEHRGLQGSTPSGKRSSASRAEVTLCAPPPWAVRPPPGA
ncbi:hypothetical protein [Streptomyces sp. SID12488]|uniref:hypothetical protein n=1 Tax=Streptomyces sp. SID12488 TaxID=2706040 RepID=UPI0013D98631|nr:hypothetical protein [Streptomyces sp. SID12488]NEA64875.1 hypothetical protein [Streptomyces sp. SID12488]